ncbi:MAG: hypothetical protein EOO50_01635 [Flavobacterium sp.]|uniref:hypothetical protein n=1 Tax=Flavobacterium sp. TaxID=239 RepID=UPI00121C9C98|nr:hypothetical protein [Flavobacterium sp.]RZJ68519.1 MAG: hypothetical protein EOO50_01635 [Flavobacterium sp.]
MQKRTTILFGMINGDGDKILNMAVHKRLDILIIFRLELFLVNGQVVKSKITKNPANQAGFFF